MVLVGNKKDATGDVEDMVGLQEMREFGAMHDFTAVIAVSAKYSDGIDAMMNSLINYLTGRPARRKARRGGDDDVDMSRDESGDDGNDTDGTDS